MREPSLVESNEGWDSAIGFPPTPFHFLTEQGALHGYYLSRPPVPYGYLTTCHAFKVLLPTVQ